MQYLKLEMKFCYCCDDNTQQQKFYFHFDDPLFPADYFVWICEVCGSSIDQKLPPRPKLLVSAK